jgi:hypothetical protein
MAWIATAIAGSAILGAFGSNRAAKTQANAQTNAANMQLGMFNTINGQEQPFMQAGYGATGKLSDMLGISGNTGTEGYGSLIAPFNPTQEQLNNYPGYQFALKTGAQAVQNASTPSAGALSSQTLKSLMGFNQGMANTNYGTYFNQYQQQQKNIYDRLYGIANLGQNAASNTGAAGTSLGTGAAQATAAAGGSLAGGIVGATNSLAGNAVPMAYMMQNQSGGEAGGAWTETNLFAGGSTPPSYYPGMPWGSP